MKVSMLKWDNDVSNYANIYQTGLQKQNKCSIHGTKKKHELLADECSFIK
jgi:hypothetical protein